MRRCLRRRRLGGGEARRGGAGGSGGKTSQTEEDMTATRAVATSRCYAYEGEEFLWHVRRALAVWQEVRRYYERSVRRALGDVGVDLVEYAIASHDLGKLADSYQKGDRFRYRPEVVSAYLAYRGLEGLGEGVRLAVAAAVLLHHEPIILSTYVAKPGERYLPVYVLRKVLEKVDLAFTCDVDLQFFQRYGKLHEVLNGWRAGGIKPADVLEVLKKVLVYVSVGEPSRTHVARAKIAALLHPLVVSDSIAAHLCRGGGGTVVSNAALNGAELVNEGDMRKKLEKEKLGCSHG
ncbi:MAG: hypothetical protein ACK4SY_10450 [Pyrobaculum sp.]